MKNTRVQTEQSGISKEGFMSAQIEEMNQKENNREHWSLRRPKLLGECSEVCVCVWSW